MRYIFTAAIGTLLFIAALLALPPIGEPETTLVAQTTGDRLAVTGSEVATESTTTTAVGPARQAQSPSSTEAERLLAEVLAEVQIPEGLADELNADRDELVIAETTTTTSTTTTPPAAQRRRLPKHHQRPRPHQRRLLRQQRLRSNSVAMVA